jgi:hypothetical protein
MAYLYAAPQDVEPATWCGGPQYGSQWPIWPRLCRILDLDFLEFNFRNCPKSLGRPRSVTLRVATEGLFGSFRPLYTSQIDGRSVARTPFRTVSPDTWVNKGEKKGRGVVSTLAPGSRYRDTGLVPDEGSSSSCPSAVPSQGSVRKCPCVSAPRPRCWPVLPRRT